MDKEEGPQAINLGAFNFKMEQVLGAEELCQPPALRLPGCILHDDRGDLALFWIVAGDRPAHGGGDPDLQAPAIGEGDLGAEPRASTSLGRNRKIRPMRKMQAGGTFPRSTRA